MGIIWLLSIIFFILQVLCLFTMDFYFDYDDAYSENYSLRKITLHNRK